MSDPVVKEPRPLALYTSTELLDELTRRADGCLLLHCSYQPAETWRYRAKGSPYMLRSLLDFGIEKVVQKNGKDFEKTKYGGKPEWEA
jgi:hypothetical protein